MNDQLVKEFGSVLAAQILPIEVEERDCPDILFPVILLLRLLLGDSRGVFYKTMWEVEDGNTHYTDIFIYDAGSEFRKASLKKFASAHVDTAISVSWENGREDFRGEKLWDDSYGVIRWLSFSTALGSVNGDAQESVVTLLQMAAATNDEYELLVETVQEGVTSLKLRSYNLEAPKLIDLGFLHWSTTDSRCSRFYDNRGDCAFQLK
jgi:hypothetical protein